MRLDVFRVVMSETENLILLIESRPCLWDTSNEDYHDKEKKSSAWSEICHMLVQNWETLTAGDRRLKCLELKRKWSNCRDYYKKDTLRCCSSTGSAVKKAKRYVYADLLGFLDKVLKINLDGSSDVDDCELVVMEDDDDGQWETRRAVEGIKNEHKHKTTKGEPALKKKKLQHAPEEIPNVLSSKNYNASKDYDDDEKFLLSFSSDMKKMSHLQKIEFKLAMMQLLKDTFTENANSPPYYIDASTPEPRKLIYSDLSRSHEE